MGKIFKNGEDYFVEFYGNGLRFQKKAGKTKAEAERKLKEIEDSLTETGLKIDIAKVDIDLFFSTFLQYARETYPFRSYVRFQKTAQHFKIFLEAVLPSERFLKYITPEIIERYKSSLIKMKGSSTVIKPRVVNFTLWLVKEILEHAIKLGWLNDNPALHLKFLPYKAHSVPKVYNIEEIKEMLSCPIEEDRIFTTMIVNTGLTLPEIGDLHWRDVDFANSCLYVRRNSELRNGCRIIPMTTDVKEALKERHFQDANEEDKIFKIVKLSEGINVLRLRNFFAKSLLEKGMPLSKLNTFMGFSDIAKVFRYNFFIIHQDELKF